MDREIPKEVRNKERNKKIIRYGGMGAAGIVVISVLISLINKLCYFFLGHTRPSCRIFHTVPSGAGSDISYMEGVVCISS